LLFLFTVDYLSARKPKRLQALLVLLLLEVRRLQAHCNLCKKQH